MTIQWVGSPNFRQGRSGYVPEVIVLHIMAGSLQGTDSWFSTPTSQVSAHYGIGKGGEIHQYVDCGNTAWANGIVNKPNFRLLKPGINPNLYTISIEHEGNDLNFATEAGINASVELIRMLAGQYGIPIDRDHIIGHYQVDSVKKPNCPGVDKSIIDRIITRAQGGNAQVVAQIRELLGKIV